jgi:ABC-2 type transport system ATP-binding protein
LRGEEGLTLLLTTHRADEAEFCDRIAVLDRGRVVDCGTPDQLRDRVRGDLLVLEAEDPERIAATLAERFGASTRVLDGKILLRRERAHEMIPRLVEALPGGSLRSISLRRTGLGEVFLELTGHELQADPEESPPPPAVAEQGEPR